MSPDIHDLAAAALFAGATIGVVLWLYLAIVPGRYRR